MLSSQSSSPHLSAGRGVTRRGRDEENKEIGERLWRRRQCPRWPRYGSLMSVSWSWSVPAKSLQSGDLRHPKLWSRLFLVQAGTGTAGTCDMLTKKLSVCESFLLAY